MLAKSKYWKVTSEIILPLLAIISLAGLFWAVFFSPLFTIKQVICVADWKPCENENILTELQRAKGANLFLYDSSPLTNKLKANNFLVKEVIVTKELPDRLVVTTQSVNPSAAVRVSSVDSTWIVCDEQGRVIRVTDANPNVPTVVVEHLPTVRVGQPIDDQNIIQALKVAIVLRGSNLHYSDLALVDSMTIAVKLESGVSALLTTDKDIDPQVKALQQVLSDSTIKKESYNTIDVRFGGAIIRKN